MVLGAHIWFQVTLWASNLFSAISRNFLNFFHNSFNILVKLLLFSISYRKQTKYGMPKQCNYVKEKGGGKWRLKISLLESLDSARLSSNSGWNGDLLGKDLSWWCQHRKSKRESREQINSSLGSSIQFIYSLYFYGCISLLGSKFCFYFGTSNLLLRDLQEIIQNLKV